MRDASPRCCASNRSPWSAADCRTREIDGSACRRLAGARAHRVRLRRHRPRRRRRARAPALLRRERRRTWIPSRRKPAAPRARSTTALARRSAELASRSWTRQLESERGAGRGCGNRATLLRARRRGPRSRSTTSRAVSAHARGVLASPTRTTTSRLFETRRVVRSRGGRVPLSPVSAVDVRLGHPRGGGDLRWRARDAPPVAPPAPPTTTTTRRRGCVTKSVTTSRSSLARRSSRSSAPRTRSPPARTPRFSR